MATKSTVVGSVTETTEQKEESSSSTLKLKLTKKKQTKKIQWTEDTVDNEGVNDFCVYI